ncbi:TesA Lysophospholipase L1 and related esterases [Candidatus Nanopelagicaceae bacterium]
MTFKRFIALGDSFTEGMTDEVIDGNYRGWADRVADILTLQTSEFTYVNLAVRGKLVKQVTEDQVPLAIPLITGKETLLSFHAGANDVLRPNYRPENVFPIYNEAVRKLAATGATLMLFTVLERTGNTGKTADMWAERFGTFNKNIRAIAAEVGAIIVDANEEKFLSDRRLLAFDRLHLNPLGHDRVAQGVLEVLGMPFDPNWRLPLPIAKPTPWLVKKATSAAWFITFALPWIWRRIRGKSSGDGRSAKYPEPINWPISR